MNLSVDQVNSGEKYEFCCVIMVKIENPILNTNDLSSHLFPLHNIDITSQQFISTKSRQTKLSNAYFKHSIQQMDYLLPW